jgi:hypothetical protein
MRLLSFIRIPILKFNSSCEETHRYAKEYLEH